MIEIDRLTRQNQLGSQKITKLQAQVQCLKNDLITAQQLIKNKQFQKQRLKKQIQTLKRQRQQDSYEKQNTQNRYLVVLNKLEEELGQSKNKYQGLESKIQPLLDYDSVRLKILNQVQMTHDIQIQQYRRTIQSLKDQILRLKRQNSTANHKNQTLKMDFQEQIRLLKANYKNQSNNNQINSLSLQMSREVQGRLRMSYESARKQGEYYKQKYFQCQKKYQEKIAFLEKQLRLIRANS